MPGTDTLKLFHDAFGYNSIRFVMILVNLLLDKGHYISSLLFCVKFMVKPPMDYCVLFIRQDEHSNHSQRFLFIQLTLFLNYRNAPYCYSLLLCSQLSVYMFHNGGPCISDYILSGSDGTEKLG